MNKIASLIFFLFFSTVFCYSDKPYYVDFTKVANSDIEDDGLVKNGKGGWTDEGINDMFTYPALPTGKFERNGYHFNILDPKKNDGKSIILLAGENLKIKRPKSVTIPVADQKAKYLYFLQSFALNPPKLPPNYTVATYTLTYADGTTAELPVRAGIEIRGWWSSQWFDNSGPKSWPIHMGRNIYSMKWKKYIGVWAMEWVNPHPDKAIKSITLTSAGRAVPAIFAITLTNDHYSKGPDSKKDYKRPPNVPKGYFDEKQAGENRLVFKEMIKSGQAKGIRNIALIRNDILAVTVDPAWGKIGGGQGASVAAALQKTENFTIASRDDDNFKSPAAPSEVGRFSYERWLGDIGPFPQCRIYWHTYYLFLPKPLKAGAGYTITLKDMDPKFKGQVKFSYDPAKSATPVIKINQVAYCSKSKQRYAYLGWWAGDAGAVDYSKLKTFSVIDEKTGKPAMTGEISLRAKDDKLSGEDVYQMDIAALTSGRYHILIDGLGRSDSFGVGDGMDKIARATHRAFYHQRCGMALEKPYTTFTKPACHTEVYKSGRLVGAADYKPKPNEPIRTFKYGYHDAADFDVFTYHLRATSEALYAYELFPKSFGDDLNIPESGNKLPDVLDEADWALRGYLELQQPDGAVPLGRGNDQDAIRALRSRGQNPEYGILPPETISCAEYASTAALYARLVKPFDKKRSAEYLQSAVKAFDWALKHPNTGRLSQNRTGDFFTAWAAAELFSATGEKRFNDIFLKLHRAGAILKSHWKLTGTRAVAAWPYTITKQPGADKTVQEELKKALVNTANGVVRSTQTPAYRMGRGNKGGAGWGNAHGGGRYGVSCLLAWKLTGEQKYLDAASLNADFQLGANPLSKTFITGLGARPPVQPQISSFLYSQPGKRGKTVEGIPIFGLASAALNWYPANVPVWRRYRDLGAGAEVCSEFTITETVGEAAMLYGVLNAMEGPKSP